MVDRPGTLDTRRFALLDRLVRRMDRDGQVTDEVREAVDMLTAAADPARADRLAVQPGEPAVLTERLAVWALRRTTDRAVADATRLLDDAGVRQIETQLAGEPAPTPTG